MRLSSSQIEAIKQKTGYYFGVDARICLSGLRVGDNQRPQGGATQATCIQPKAGQDRLRRWVPPSGARTSARPRCLRQDRPKGECLAVSPLRGDAATLSQHGFTLVELIMVMVIVGILGAVVAPRFFDQSVFQARGFADQVQAALRYAQKEAIAQRRNVCVAMNATTISLTIANAGGAAVACLPSLALPVPTACGNNCISTPSAAITLTAFANFNFDALGRPWDVLGVTPSAAQKTITISGATNNITVEAETGYVH